MPFDSLDDDALRDAVRTLLDRQAVEDVVTAYATCLDARDWQGLRACFTDDAVADYGTAGHFEGADTIVAGCREPLSGLDGSQHLLGTIRVRVDGDRATATSYVHAQHVLANDQGESLAVMAGTYTQQLVRTPDGWRIEALSYDSSWRSGNPAILGEAGTGVLTRLREQRKRERARSAAVVPPDPESGA